jgi:hypothetical protein
MTVTLGAPGAASIRETTHGGTQSVRWRAVHHAAIRAQESKLSLVRMCVTWFFRGALGQMQPVGDLPVAESFGDQRGHQRRHSGPSCTAERGVEICVVRRVARPAPIVLGLIKPTGDVVFWTYAASPSQTTPDVEPLDVGVVVELLHQHDGQPDAG